MRARGWYATLLLALGATLWGIVESPLCSGPAVAPSQGPVVPISITNGDFEASDSLEPVPSHLPGWVVPPSLIMAGYRVRISEQDPYQGRACAELHTDPATWTTLPGIGSLVQELDAIALRDQTVRLSGWMRTAGGGAGQLWLQVDDPSKPSGLLAASPEEALEIAEWTRFEVVGSIANDAVGIHFGANLAGQGSLFLDDVRLEIVPTPGLAPPAPISPRGMDNLVAAGRLLDVLRFFHPSDSCALAPWDRLSVSLVAAAEPAPDAAALAEALSQFSASIAPTVMIVRDGDDPERDRRQREIDERLKESRPVALIHWNHYGVGHRDVGFPERESVYRSWRSVVEGADLTRYPRMPTVELDLGSGVRAIVPTAVYIDDFHRTLPASMPRYAGKPDGFRPSANDRTTRLAAGLYCWSILREFYPNFDLGTCPDRETWLREALEGAALDPDRDAFLATLRKMLSCLGDGHAEAHAFYPERPGKLPLRWRWIEDRLVVMEVAGPTESSTVAFDASKAIRTGDVVLSIDGQTAASVLDSLGAYVSSPTERWRRHRACERLATGAIGDTLRLLMERDGEQLEVALPMLSGEQVDAAFPSAQSEPIQTLEEGIYHVDLSRLNDAQLEQFLSQTQNPRAILFDLRGDPDEIGPQFLGRWVDSLVLSPEWKVALRNHPRPAAWILGKVLDPEIRSTRWALDPVAPRSTARLAFLVDERSISRAETYLAVAQRGLGAILVGSPSAGTLGNANRARLPGGFRITWTGMDVFKGEDLPGAPNQRLSGVGITPSILVTPTIGGVRAGRDEVLERALDAVKG